ncbi:Uncharacterised protein [Vibrio cholerae]|nr:Uncharacterised protein [Vibrio cholerae]
MSDHLGSISRIPKCSTNANKPSKTCILSGEGTLTLVNQV